MGFMISRRQLIKNAGLIGLFGATGLRSFAREHKNKNRVLRFAHLTDVHIEPELNAPAGLATCLHHLQSQKDQPAFIVSGGDCIFDALRQTKDRVELQWDLWQNIFKQESALPVEHCIGNHDCWGFGAKQDPLYGKSYALEKMGLPIPYRSFDKAGWHFVILDSIQPKSDGTWYECRPDEAQFDWLQQDLSNTHLSTPVIIISHAPIVTGIAAVVFADKKINEQGYLAAPGLMHIDAQRLVQLFEGYPNVKVCLSGHIHLYERIVYNNVNYISNGAVCGNWWKGMYDRTDNGYALINLYDDGSFDDEYISYGWNK